MVYVDRTSKSTTKLFTQIFNLFIIQGNHYIPVVFSLLPDKSTEYHQVVLDQRAPLVLNVKTVFTDSERAIHNTLMSSLPLVQIRGYRFVIKKRYVNFWTRCLLSLKNDQICSQVSFSWFSQKRLFFFKLSNKKILSI